MRKTIRIIKNVSAILVWGSLMWGYKDGCFANVLVAIIATATLAYTSVLEG